MRPCAWPWSGASTSICAPPRNDRRRGIILSAVGAGLFFFLFAVDGFDSAGLGFLPGLLGVGYLIADAVERRQSRL